jgi:uracil-DNA glycosylase
MLIINQSWNQRLEAEFQKPYFKELWLQVEQEYETTICFPPKEMLFNAFEQFDFEATRVVIIGQDPYHGTGEANGLCFSLNDGVAIPPSLKNIFQEIQSEYDQILFPVSGNLERWAKQGVLLLNTGLSVRKDVANSHKHLKWNLFTNAVIQLLNEECEHLVFLLWGSFAQKKGIQIDRDKHLVLESGHPSPLSANRGLWFGNNHFIATNDYLISHGKKAIEW